MNAPDFVDPSQLVTKLFITAENEKQSLNERTIRDKFKLDN